MGKFREFGWFFLSVYSNNEQNAKKVVMLQPFFEYERNFCRVLSIPLAHNLHF